MFHRLLELNFFVIVDVDGADDYESLETELITYSSFDLSPLKPGI